MVGDEIYWLELLTVRVFSVCMLLPLWVRVCAC